jgi:capsular exopolysaccharide synthesis family protein
MSWIFEALQQAEFDRTGFTAPEHELAATQVLRATEKEIEEAQDLHERFQQKSTLYPAISADSRLVTLAQPWSVNVEKFRLLALRLRELQQHRHLKKLLITSTVPEEGKSFVSANLAITMARKPEQRVLLVEGDLRRPALASNLGIGNHIGLSECLLGMRRLSSVVHYIEDLKLWFLPAGHPPENPVEAMQSGQLMEGLDVLSPSFDWIVIDSPPLLPLADTSVWSRVVVGTLLITRQGKTKKRELKRGIEMLDKSCILGVVINDCSSAEQSNYYERYGYNLKNRKSEVPKSNA